MARNYKKNETESLATDELDDARVAAPDEAEDTSA